MKLRLGSHLNEVSWVLVAHFISVIGGFATIKVATTILGPGDYGRFAAAVAVAGIIQVCLYGAISQTASRFLFLASAKKSLTVYLTALACLSAAAIVIIGIVWGIAVTARWNNILAVPDWLIVLFVTGSGTQMVLLAILNAARARRAVAAVQTIEAIGRPLFVVLASMWISKDPFVVLGAYALSTMVMISVSLAILFGLRRELSAPGFVPTSAVDTHLAWQMLVYATPFVMFGVVGALGNQGERLLLTAWMPWEQVGVYSLMSQMTITPTLLVASLINQFYFPVIFHQDPAGVANFRGAFRRYLLMSGCSIFILALVTLIAGPYLIPLVSTRAFLGHEHLLALLVVSAGLFGMGQQATLAGLRALRTFVYIVPKIVHSVTLLAVAILLVPGWGLDGMAAASVMAALLYVISVYVANKRGNVRV